jgi:hypothetical protein
MKCISVQLHHRRDARFHLEDLLDLVRSVGRYPEVDKDESDPETVNLNFFTEDIRLFWNDFEKGVLNDPEMGDWVKNTTIIVCEGDEGWDNYLLLWHYDQSEHIHKM